MITRKAYAKINLCLDVLRRRPDGYHEVRMIMQTIGICDTLTFDIVKDYADTAYNNNDSYLYEDESIRLEILDIPRNADLGPINKNLIYKAARLIYDNFDIAKKVVITLRKSIPVAAGMAGGSTDAAAVFHGLNDLFNLKMSIEDMCSLGVKIGADVPYCIMGGTALSEGIGEKLTPIASPPGCYLLIAKPEIDVSTKFVYENLHADKLKAHPQVDSMIEAISNHDLTKISQLLGNVLETVTVKEYPIIDTIKKTMISSGALNSLMSGSGPTVFGIFDSEAKANEGMLLLKEKGLAKEVFVTEFIN